MTEKSKETSVVSINKNKKNNDVEDSPESTKKLPIAVRENVLMRVLMKDYDWLETNGFGSFNSYPFKNEYRVTRTSELAGSYVILKIRNKTATQTDINCIASELSEYVSSLPLWEDQFQGFGIGYKQCISIVTKWANRKSDIEKLPKSWGFKSDDEVVFTRLVYDPIDVEEYGENCIEKKAPTFSNALKRMKNPEYLVQRIGSLFFTEASRKQALWFYGPSGGGKSQLSFLISALLGEKGVEILTNSDFKDTHYKASMIGKRAVFINECKSSFIRSEEFKALTGDAYHRITAKYINSYTAQLDCMVFCVSNDIPEIPDDAPLKKRLIAVYVGALEEAEKISEMKVREKYLSEVPYISAYCMKEYLKNNPGFGDIKTEELIVEEFVEAYESTDIAMLEKHFMKGSSEDYISQYDICEKFKWEGIRSNYDMSRLKKLMVRRFGCEFKSVRDKRVGVIKACVGIKKSLQ